MSTLALKPSDGAAGGRALARYADLALLAIALPVFLIADLPIAAYVAIAAAWLLQRAVQQWAASRVVRAEARTSALRLIAATFIVRLWILTAAILLVGLLAEDDAGLAAAVLAAALVTANFAGEALARPSAPHEEGQS